MMVVIPLCFRYQLIIIRVFIITKFHICMDYLYFSVPVRTVAWLLYNKTSKRRGKHVPVIYTSFVRSHNYKSRIVSIIVTDTVTVAKLCVVFCEINN